MELGRTTPILRIFDEAKATEFYVGFLGFTVDWRHRFGDDYPLYFQISRGGCVLHLSEHHGDCSPGAAVRIETRALDELNEELVIRRGENLRRRYELRRWIDMPARGWYSSDDHIHLRRSPPSAVASFCGLLPHPLQKLPKPAANVGGSVNSSRPA